MRLTFVCLLIGLFAIGCSTTRSTESFSQKNAEENDVLNKGIVNPEFALETYLRRTPGVIVNGSGTSAKVSVRGVNSFSAGTEPLFIVNGTDVGNSYNRAAELLRGMDIKSVTVLKGSDASIYGVRGGGGVIQVTAK